MRTFTCIFIALLLSISCDKGTEGTLDKAGIATAIKKEVNKEAKAATKAKVKFVDKQKKTYHATFEGPLKCGDKRINLKGYVNREP